jgi:hypothetical protein
VHHRRSQDPSGLRVGRPLVEALARPLGRRPAVVRGVGGVEGEQVPQSSLHRRAAEDSEGGEHCLSCLYLANSGPQPDGPVP